MGFAIGRTAANKRTGAWSKARVDTVNVKGYGVATGGSRNEGKRVGDTVGHSAFVNVAHCKEIVPKPEFFDLRAFAAVDIAGTDVGEILSVELGSKAAKVNEIRMAVAEDNREGHAVDVAGRRRLRCIDVGVGVKPYKADLRFLIAIMRCY